MATHKMNASQTNASVQTARLKLAVTVKGIDKQIVPAANQDSTWKMVNAGQTNANAQMGRLELALTVENTVKQTVLAAIQDFTHRG